MCENILTESDYKQILSRRFNRNDVKLVNSKVTPLSDQVHGFAGDHFKIEISCELDGEEKMEKFFLKTKPTKTNIQKEIVSDLNVYPKEIFLYNSLLPEFEKYGFDTSFAPKCFHYVPNESLVLEDITLKGFCAHEMYKPFDVEQCKCGLRALALLHGAGYMYEEVKSKELGRPFRLNVEYPEYFANEAFYSTEQKSFGIKWIESARKALLVLIDYLPESVEYKEEFKKRFSQTEFGKAFSEESNIRKALGHGDLWSNNIMFISQDGVAEQGCLFDYQLLRYYYPAFDVIVFIYTNTTREFRKIHWEDLSKFYYTSLSDILSELGYPINDLYSEEDYKKSLEIVEFDAKIQGFVCESEWCYSQEFLSDIINSGKEDLKDLWFGDRTPHLVKSFQCDEVFRNMMTGCLYDLHDILFKN